MRGDSVDHEARRKADLAMQAIEAHEAHCGERWGEARRAAEATNKTVSEGFEAASASARRLHERIDKILWAVAGELILLLVGALGSLIFYLLTR